MHNAIDAAEVAGVDVCASDRGVGAVSAIGAFAARSRSSANVFITPPNTASRSLVVQVDLERMPAEGFGGALAGSVDGRPRGDVEETGGLVLKFLRHAGGTVLGKPGRAERRLVFAEVALPNIANVLAIRTAGAHLGSKVRGERVPANNRGTFCLGRPVNDAANGLVRVHLRPASFAVRGERVGQIVGLGLAKISRGGRRLALRRKKKREREYLHLREGAKPEGKHVSR